MKKLSLITAALAALLLAGCKGFLPSPGGPEASGTPSAGKKGEVVINEVVSSNTLSHRDPAYGTPDWIEFKNIGDAEADISGRRIAGDAAQDYIVGKQFALGDERNSSVKITTAEGKQITCDCSIGDVVVFGGKTLDVNAFGCTIRFNGKPTVTSAA